MFSLEKMAQHMLSLQDGPIPFALNCAFDNTFTLKILYLQYGSNYTYNIVFQTYI
jgi:hypothetical protein